MCEVPHEINTPLNKIAHAIFKPLLPKAPQIVIPPVSAAPASQAAAQPSQAATRASPALTRSAIGALLSGSGGVANSSLSLGKNQYLGQ